MSGQKPSGNFRSMMAMFFSIFDGLLVFKAMLLMPGWEKPNNIQASAGFTLWESQMRKNRSRH